MDIRQAVGCLCRDRGIIFLLEDISRKAYDLLCDIGTLLETALFVGPSCISRSLDRDSLRPAGKETVE